MSLQQISAFLALADKCTAGPWKPLVVSGDANQYRNPSNTLHLNSSAAWAVTPRKNSTIRAKYDAEFICAARNSVEAIRELIERLEAAEEVADALNRSLGSKMRHSGQQTARRMYWDYRQKYPEALRQRLKE